jgi:hypothetical protein
MMEAVRTSETSVNLYVTIRRYIPEDTKLHFNDAALYYLKVYFKITLASTPRPTSGIFRLDYPTKMVYISHVPTLATHTIPLIILRTHAQKGVDFVIYVHKKIQLLQRTIFAFKKTVLRIQTQAFV